jgi:hypothetical protein
MTTFGRERKILTVLLFSYSLVFIFINVTRSEKESDSNNRYMRAIQTTAIRGTLYDSNI